MKAIDRLSAYTYEVRHNPNCPAPFLIVTTGTGGHIDGKGSFYSYGKTLDHAADAALRRIQAHDRERQSAAEDRSRVWRVTQAERAVRGVVWA